MDDANTSEEDESYRAYGSNPDWSLTISRDQIRCDRADGSSICAAKPESKPTRAGEIFETPEMTVGINNFRRSVGADGRQYHDTVRVTIGEQTLTGWGGRPVDE